MNHDIIGFCHDCDCPVYDLQPCILCGSFVIRHSVSTNSDSNFSSEYEYQSEEAEATEVPSTVAVEAPLFESIEATDGSTRSDDVKYTDLDEHLYSSEAQIEKYLARPVLIWTSTWSSGGGIDDEIDPWTAFLSTTNIKNKIQNYGVGSMQLHVKIMVNCSPFYYGAALVTYQPLSAFNPGRLDLSEVEGAKVGLSQRPHIWIYPHNQQGGDLVLPFLWNRSSINLGSSNQVGFLGRIRIKSYTLLNAATASAGDCTVQVYCHATNVRLGAPTYSAVLQSDEYEEGPDGPVSGIASAVANVAGRLTDLPVIGDFAKATTIGASAISKIAHMFGFTDVPVIKSAEPLKSLVFHSLTSATIGEPVEKLSLDAKSEVTIDPGVIGYKETEDSLLISNFVKRESWIDTFTWTSSNAASTLLWACRVQPSIFRKGSTLGPYNSYTYNGTPVSHVSQAFKYWRGTMKYKFTVVASKFHRGRIVINWDPFNGMAATQQYLGYNFTKVVDIAEESEFVVEIPYCQTYPFCQTKRYVDDSTAVFGTSALTPNDGYDNGILTVRVFTKQSSPLSTSNIDILVSVMGGDDLEFAMPRDINFKAFAYQSEEGVQDHEASTLMSISNPDVDDKRYLISFGERIVSLRTLMRRATLNTAYTVPYTGLANTSMRVYKSLRSVMPYPPGFDPNGIIDANKAVSGTAKYTPGKYHPILWFGSCFVGRRGSIIHHLNTNSGTSPDFHVAVSYSPDPHPLGTFSGSDTLFTANSVNQCSSIVTDDLGGGASGLALTNQQAQPGISVLVPYNSIFKFQFTGADFMSVGSTWDGSIDNTMDVKIITRDDTMLTIADFISIGTDFSLCYFCNVPTVWAGDPVTPTP